MSETPPPERKKRPNIRIAENALRAAGFSRREAARIAHGGVRYAFLITEPSSGPSASRRWWQFWLKGDQK